MKTVMILVLLTISLIVTFPTIYGELDYDIITTDKKLYDQNDLIVTISGTLHPSINGNASIDYGRIISFTIQGPIDHDIEILNFWSQVDRDGNFIKEFKIIELDSEFNDGFVLPTNGIYTIKTDIGNYRHLETTFQFGESFLDLKTNKQFYNLHEIILISGNGDFEFKSYNIELINPNGDLSAMRTITSDIHGDFKTGFQVDHLVNLVSGNYTIQISNIEYSYSKVIFEIDNINETQKVTKPKNILEHETINVSKLIKENNLSNLKLKLYFDTIMDNENLKIENELLKLQIINLQKLIDDIQSVQTIK